MASDRSCPLGRRRGQAALPARRAWLAWLAVLAALAVILGAVGSLAMAAPAGPSTSGIVQPMASTSQADDGAGDQVRQRRLRLQMVAEQIRSRGVTSPRVLAAMEEVPRHLFVPDSERDQAYEDHPLPIGGGQTISQPYIVGLMTALLDLRPGSRVLEIGTGSGYQAAVLSRVAGQVYSVEIVPALGAQARETLARLGYDNVHVRIGDGYRGWPEAAPFDGILLTAAPHAVPPPLLAQLKPGGRLVLPLGGFDQELMLLTKGPDGAVKEEKVLPVRFVPMTGEAERKP
jgi:protein-L-isoaspartate(D-aspartate) O-methyltransferase